MTRVTVSMIAVLMSCGGPGPSDGGAGGGAGGGSGGGFEGYGDSCDGGGARFTLSGALNGDGTYSACSGILSGHSGNVVRTFFGRSDFTSTHMINRAVDLLFPAAPGTYVCDGGFDVTMAYQYSYTALDGSSTLQGRWESNAPGMVSCTLTITTLEATKGGAIRGTFSAVLPPKSGHPAKPDAGVTITNGVIDTLYE